MKHMAKPTRRPGALLLALAVLFTTFCALRLPASAAGTPTSLGLGEHGIMAYEDGWLYSYGGKGETNSDGVRVSDCAGLIYAYFKDLGAEAGCWGGATSQVTYNCVFSGDVDELYGIPRIHGLVVTMPDYNDPATGIYSHIGIYIGNNMATDNSDYNVNMVMDQVVGSGRGWTAWHVFDNGMLYPSNGWYEFNNNLYHYTDCQYDVDTVVDGFTIGSDGIALGSDGQPLTVDSPEAPALSDSYVSASTVAQQLKSLGYSGKDSTQDLVDGGDVPGDDLLNGRITASGVRLRKEATTQSAQVAILSKNDQVQIVETVSGEPLNIEGVTSDQWYSVVTSRGLKGYVFSAYVEKESTLETPVFSLSDSGDLLITAGDGCDIRYTTDGTHPTAESTPYTGPISISGTYRAIAVQDDWTSPMATITYAGNKLFTDFTSEDWYFEQVDQVVALGLFSGDGTTFAPTRLITRAEFASALANLAGVDVSDYQGTSSFSDVGNAWYNGAVNWVSSMNIMSGMGDGTFRPNDPITREQLCVAIANYGGLTYSGSATAFADDSSISSWARNAVYACKELGLISGMGNNTFAPKDNSQRCHACTIILNAYNKGL
ncbi:s-layer domain-containing protein [Clostridium sp. CAG:1013]|nr:s-layer domain-containing protein [Clostridium sp. CAG:1013]